MDSFFVVVARNKVCVVRAQSELVHDVHSARFAKDAAVPVGVVRDVDKPDILECVCEIFLVERRQMGDRRYGTRDFASAEMRLVLSTDRLFLPCFLPSYLPLDLVTDLVTDLVYYPCTTSCIYSLFSS